MTQTAKIEDPAPVAPIQQIDTKTIASELKAEIKSEVDQQAMSAVSTVMATANVTLVVLAVAIAIFALVGWGVIGKMAKRNAERIANRRFNEYIDTEKFAKIMQSRIDAAVASQWQESLLENGLTEGPKAQDDVAPFPDRPGE